MKQLLGAATVLLAIAGSASAATIAGAPAETGSTMLIGAGLMIVAGVTRLRTKRS